MFILLVTPLSICLLLWAHVSGYKSPLVAFVLFLIGTAMLAISGWDWCKKRGLLRKVALLLATFLEKFITRQ